MKRSAAGLIVLLALCTAGCHDDDDDDVFIVTTSAADLNLDGFADLVIGAPRDATGTTAERRSCSSEVPGFSTMSMTS